MKSEFRRVSFAALLVFTAACSSGVSGGGGGSGGESTTSTTTSTSTTTPSTSDTTTVTTTSTTTNSGTGGAPIALDAGTDAASVCSPPASTLASGQLGGPECACLCALEAPAILHALATAAVAAYAASGAVCAGAFSVPAAVPPTGKCYQPASFEGMDFHTGDASTGWKCLGADLPALAEPIHCQLSYRVGSGYLGPALGGPDPGPTGFEIAAQGDFDGNLAYSTFTIAGTIDSATHQVTLSPLFQHDPQE